MEPWPADLLRDVLEEHFDEACFLWQQRQRALTSRTMNRRDLKRLDERLLAHLDGLLLGGEPAWSLIAHGLQGPGEAAARVAAFIALALDTEERIDTIYTALINAPFAVCRGVQLALRCAPGSRVKECLPRWLHAAHWRVRAVALDALSCRLEPLSEATIAELLGDHAPAVRTAAAAAAGRYHLPALLSALERLIDDTDVEVRTAALSSAVLLGSEPAARRCRELALAPGPLAALGFTLLGRLGAREDRDRIFAPELARPAPLPAAVGALASFGDPETLPWLIRLCAERRYAGLVTAVVQRVTGTDLIAAGVAALPGSPADPVAELDDVALAALPAADGEKLAAFLTQHRRGLPAGRLCLGRPYGPEPIKDALRDGPLGDHAELAFELARLGAAPYDEPHPLL